MFDYILSTNEVTYMNKSVFISMSNYLQVKHCLTEELRLNDRSKIKFANIEKVQCRQKDYQHRVRMNVYIEVDTDWVKKARASIKHFGLFDIIKNEKKVLRTYKKIKTTVHDF